MPSVSIASLGQSDVNDKTVSSSGNAPHSARPPNASDTPSYSYADIEAKLQEDEGVWNHFKHLPKASELQFSSFPREHDPHALPPHLPNVLSKRLWVGTWTQDVNAETDQVYAYVHGYVNYHARISQVSYFKTSNQGFQPVSVLVPEVEFAEPFKYVHTQRTETRRTRLRFLILFYFLEKGLLDKLIFTQEGMHSIRMCCEKIAAFSRHPSIEPARSKRPTTKIADAAIQTKEAPKTAVSAPLTPFESKDYVQSVKTVSENKLAYQWNSPMARPTNEGSTDRDLERDVSSKQRVLHRHQPIVSTEMLTPPKTPNPVPEEATGNDQQFRTFTQSLGKDHKPTSIVRTEPAEGDETNGNGIVLKRSMGTEISEENAQSEPKRQHMDDGFRHYQQIIQHIKKQTDGDLEQLKTENVTLRQENAKLKKWQEVAERKVSQATETLQHSQTKIKELEAFRDGIMGYASKFQPNAS
ncbi:hypothetical protein K491DRAFT_760838 [Lophiostoma macrostomum CBS 122681]|uniref:Uncharacterized protein n=1 Tax=Lophiostoma macrostomum CBS 122681 TaxID=1314788 RepID=A0A6A6SXL0_9PLEO|nr:hypothetical protein K491DRAFT_760838 [Lophiostoma macrostomum CBS 122681]